MALELNTSSRAFIDQQAQQAGEAPATIPVAANERTAIDSMDTYLANDTNRNSIWTQYGEPYLSQSSEIERIKLLTRILNERLLMAQGIVRGR